MWSYVIGRHTLLFLIGEGSTTRYIWNTSCSFTNFWIEEMLFSMGTLPKHSVWESHHGLILVKPSICLGQLIGGNSQCYCWWITLPYACKNESMYAPMWFSKTLFMDYHNNSHAHAHTYTFLMYVCYDILHFFSQAYFLLSVLCINKSSRWHNGDIISYFILNII